MPCSDFLEVRFELQNYQKILNFFAVAGYNLSVQLKFRNFVYSIPAHVTGIWTFAGRNVVLDALL